MKWPSWNKWWVRMFAAFAVALIASAFFLPFWWWWTLAVIFFGIPEAIGSKKQDDQFPPLTHLIVRFIDREIAFPLLFGFAGAIGAYWFGFSHPGRLGLLVGLIGWLTAHFGRRYEQKEK